MEASDTDGTCIGTGIVGTPSFLSSSYLHFFVVVFFFGIFFGPRGSGPVCFLNKT